MHYKKFVEFDTNSEQSPGGEMEHVGTFYSGWLIWAVIAAFVAWDKNRSGLIWFLITWFFGPLALVFLFFFMDTIKKKDSSGG